MNTWRHLAMMYGFCLSLKNEIVKIAPKGRVNVVAPGTCSSHMQWHSLAVSSKFARLGEDADGRTVPQRSKCGLPSVGNVCHLRAASEADIRGDVLTKCLFLQHSSQESGDSGGCSEPDCHLVITDSLWARLRTCPHGGGRHGGSAA